MPLSYPSTLPSSPAPNGISIRPRSVVGVEASPFSLQAQSYAWSGQLWLATVSLPRMTRAQAEDWIATLVGLNGREGSFLLGDSAGKTPRGVATGTPLVNGGSQTGYDLVTDGWSLSVTGIMKKGDWVQLGSGSTAQLYKVMADVNSNGSGQATLTLWPKLRSSPSDNAALTVNSAKGKFMLADEIEWSVDSMRFYGLSFTAIEDRRP